MIKVIKKILQELKENIGKFRFYSMFIFITLISLLLTLEPLFFGKIIQELEKYYTNGDFDTKAIINITVIWFFYTIIAQFLKYIVFQNISTKYSLIDYKKSIKKYCDITLSMTMQEYLGKKIGSIYKLIDRGTENKLFILFNIFELYIYNIASTILVLIILLFINIKMTVISLILLPIMIFFGYYFSKVTQKKQIDISKKWESIFQVVGNAMSNYSLFKILSLEYSFSKIINKKADNSYEKQMKLNKTWNFSEIYTQLVIALTRIMVLSFGVFLIKSGELSLAELFVIFTYIEWLYFQIGIIFTELRNTVRQSTEIGRMYDELGNLKIEDDLEIGKQIKKFKGNIEFKNVNFSYIKNRKIINDFNLNIKAGEQIAIVGNTGAGKSTIVNLLLRFWELDKGGIYLDGDNIADFSKKSLRSHIGVVSQDNSLFNLSIKENLLFANPKATKKDLEKAIKQSEAHFVFDLNDGIDTVIGERGLKLSGGEKQRLSIAKLFLKSPEVLILDEATSALDNKTEKFIQKALEKLMKGRTSIIIAHRLSTIKNADRIFMLENGKIVEEGSYEELMKKKDKFYDLANPDHLIIN